MVKQISRKDFWFMTIAGYLCMINEGMLDNLSSVTLPLLKERFDFDDVYAGWFNAVWSAGYLVFTFLGATLIQAIGFRWIMVLGFVGGIVGSFIIAFVPNFALVIFGQFITCMGIGLCDIAPEALGSLIFTTNTARHMTFLVAFYALGATISPALAGIIANTTTLGYTGIYTLMCIPFLIMGLYVLLIPFKVTKPEDVVDDFKKTDGKDGEKTKKVTTVWKSLITPSVWLFGFEMAALTIVDRAGLNWAGLYIEEVLHLDVTTTGALFNSLYFALYTVTRVFGGFLTDCLGYVNTLYLTVVGAFVLYLIGFLTGEVGLWFICATSVFVALYWPTMLCLIIEYYGNVDGTINIGVILPMQSFIQLVLLPIQGALNDALGDDLAFKSTLVISIISLLLLIWLHILLNKREKARKAEEKEKDIEMASPKKVENKEEVVPAPAVEVQQTAETSAPAAEPAVEPPVPVEPVSEPTPAPAEPAPAVEEIKEVPQPVVA